MSEPIENFMSLFEPNWGHAQKQDLKMFQRMAVLQFFVNSCNQRRDHKEDSMKSIGGRLRRWRKQGRELPVWIKSTVERYFFYIGGCKLVNIEHL